MCLSKIPTSPHLPPSIITIHPTHPQIIAVRPNSRGSITLRSNDPFDNPALNPGYLSDEQGRDLGALRWGVRYARELCETAAFKEYLQDEYWPGVDVQVGSGWWGGDDDGGMCAMAIPT